MKIGAGRVRKETCLLISIKKKKIFIDVNAHCVVHICISFLPHILSVQMSCFSKSCLFWNSPSSHVMGKCLLKLPMKCVSSMMSPEISHWLMLKEPQSSPLSLNVSSYFSSLHLQLNRQLVDEILLKIMQKWQFVLFQSA